MVGGVNWWSWMETSTTNATSHSALKCIPARRTFLDETLCMFRTMLCPTQHVTRLLAAGCWGHGLACSRFRHEPHWAYLWPMGVWSRDMDEHSTPCDLRHSARGWFQNHCLQCVKHRHKRGTYSLMCMFRSQRVRTTFMGNGIKGWFNQLRNYLWGKNNIKQGYINNDIHHKYNIWLKRVNIVSGYSRGLNKNITNWNT